MADEEVDWGVDELNETNGVVSTADEDVLSLGGEADEASPAPAPVAVEKEKKAPTEPKSSETSVPAENLDENGTPLPAGWTKIVSRTHGKIFYHNTTTKETSWEIPVAAPVAKPEESTKEGSPPKSSPKVEDKENPKPAPGPNTGVSPQTARAAPSGPASWRSAQAQESPKVHGQAQVRNREREADHDRDRDNKRTRMSSPNGQGNGSGDGNGNGNRFPSRAEPPRRQRSPLPGPSSMSRGSSYRNDPPREPFNNQGAGPRSNNGPGLPVRQPTGPGLNNHGFGDRDRRRDMDPPSRPARDRSPPRGPRPENQTPAPSSFRPPPGVAGSNRAPIANNRWGAAPSGSSTPSVNGRGSQEPSRSNSGSNQNSNSVALADRITKPTPAPAVDERARLLEKKRKAQEELDKIKEEEERLEKIELGKTADEDRIKRREEERRKEDELAEARRRGLPNPPPRGSGFGPSAGRGDFDRERDRAPFRDDRDRDGGRGGSWRRDDDDRRDFDGRRDDDRNYPPRRTEPRDRPSMGSGGKSPFEPSSYRPSHPPSPPPLSARLRSPPPRRALSPRPRSRSPPPRMGGGDSYRPDRDGPSLPPREMGMRKGGPRDRDPRPTFAEPMSSYAQSRGPPRDRPLAERMSLDDRDRRYPPRDDRDRDRRW